MYTFVQAIYVFGEAVLFAVCKQHRSGVCVILCEYCSTSPDIAAVPTSLVSSVSAVSSVSSVSAVSSVSSVSSVSAVLRGS